MQLKLSFSALLAGVLIALSAQDAEAMPTIKRNRGMITVPLRRVEQQDRDLHPLVLHQQVVNRAVRRHARMTGRAIPSDLQLRSAMEKRVVSLDGQITKRYNRYVPRDEPEISKRFNRAGVPDPRSLHYVTSEFKKKGGKKAAAAAAAAGAGADAAATAATSSASGVSADTVTVSDTPTTNNSVALDIESTDVSYLSPVQLGTPPTQYLLLMDSGSADTWVGSETCQSEGGGGCGDHTFLGSQSSSTFQATTNSFQVTYGTGSVQGTIISDNLNIAGIELDNHTFGVADVESEDFSGDDTPFDGLMGLAQSTLSEQQTLTPPESMAQAGLIDAAITSFKIPRLADDLKDGEVTFGGLDSSKFDATTLTTVDNVSQDGFWEGAMDAVTVNGQDTGLTGRTAILDTGTTLIIAPGTDADAVHQLIAGATSDGQGSFTVPCTTNASVALTFGGQSFSIDTRDLAFQPVDANDPTGDCISGISSGEIGAATEWLVGDVFLKNAYFSVNVDDNNLSLAKLV